MKHHCDTCFYKREFTTPPTQGDSDDGVMCSNEQMAVIDDCVEDFKTQGVINLWRVERIGGECECSQWMPGCPVCGLILVIRAKREMDIQYLAGEWTVSSDPLKIAYKCAECGYVIPPKTIRDVLDSL